MDKDLEINKLRGGRFQWRVSAHKIPPDKFSALIQISAPTGENPSLLSLVIQALEEIAVLLASNDAHVGDPCKKCGIPHDEVPVGKCMGDNELTTEKCPVCGEDGPYKVYPPMEGCYHPDNELTTEKYRGPAYDYEEYTLT